MKYNAKKGLHPVSTVIVAAGVFGISGIANGFLGKTGEDVYESLKRRIGIVTEPRPVGERILGIQCGVRGPNSVV